MWATCPLGSKTPACCPGPLSLGREISPTNGRWIVICIFQSFICWSDEATPRCLPNRVPAPGHAHFRVRLGTSRQGQQVVIPDPVRIGSDIRVSVCWAHNPNIGTLSSPAVDDVKRVGISVDAGNDLRNGQLPICSDQITDMRNVLMPSLRVRLCDATNLTISHDEFFLKVLLLLGAKHEGWRFFDIRTPGIPTRLRVKVAGRNDEDSTNYDHHPR